MANKRVSELAPITAPELNFADLLLLADISAHESKKLLLSDLSDFLLSGGHLTGSLLGTSSYAQFAATASVALNTSVPSLVPSASFLLFTPGQSNGTASYALNGMSSSFSLFSALAITASYALTSSVQFVFSSAFADIARTSSYLSLTPGSSNGTASYALTASSFLGLVPQVSSSYAATASVALIGISASRAVSSANADTSSYNLSSSFLNYSGVPNGTASYALVAGNFVNAITDYGVFLAITQSITSSQIDVVTINPTFGGLKTTLVEANGTLRVPFTASAATDGLIELWVVDRSYGFSQSLDSTPITALYGGCTGSLSGSLRIPFTLNGQASLNGQYDVFVTASRGIFIDGARTCRFSIAGNSDQFSVSTGTPLLFVTDPTTVNLLWSSSLHLGNAYQGSCSQVTFSGSYDVTELLVPPSSVDLMSYTWTLTGLRKLTADGNASLTRIGGLPASSSFVSMSAANCSLIELPPLSSSFISYLNVPNNFIVTTLNTPSSMSYINVSNNFFVTLPDSLPAGLSALFADGLGLAITPLTMPDSIISMSFANCSNLTTWQSSTFPSSLYYLNTSNSPLLANIPSPVPAPLFYANVSTCSLSATAVSTLAQGLVTNGLSNGTLNFSNNPNSSSAINIITNITTLRSRGWTVNGH